MTICKFYQQGNCRYGDRCRFDHPRSLNGSYDARDVINRRSGFGDLYSTDHGGKYGPSNYSNQGGGGRRSGDYQTHNRFKPLTDQGGGHSRQPTQSQNFRDMSTSQIIEALSDSMDLWKEGNMWLFTCVSLGGDSECLPGFEDYSPEELRLKAYEAQRSSTVDSYRRWISQLTSEVEAKRQELLKPSATTRKQLVDVIETLKKGTTSHPKWSDGIFGSGFSNSNSQSTGLFGKPSNPSVGLFGKPVDQPTTLFSTPSTQPASVFGNDVFSGSAPKSVFGGTSNVQASGAFANQGSGDSMGTTVAQGGNGLFGKPAAFTSSFALDQSKTSTPFAPANQNSTKSSFGQPTSNSPFAKANQATGGTFGQSTHGNVFSPITQDNLGKTDTFGQPKPSFQTPGFGSSPIASSSGSFGMPTVSQTGAFGTPVLSQPSTFGVPVVAQYSAFGTPVVSQSSAFTTSSGAQATAAEISKDQVAAAAGTSDPNQDRKFECVYTPIDKLSTQERAQFEAPQFVLGKIPLCPPPRELI